MPLELVSSTPTTTVGGNGAPAPAAAAPAAAKTDTPVGAPADVNIDPKTLAHITRLSKENREVKAREVALQAAIKEAEAKAASTPAEVAAKAARLDKLEAAKAKPLEMLKELGVEFEAIIQAQLDADPEAPASPEAVKALAEIEAIKTKMTAKDEAEVKAKTEREAAEAKAQTDAANGNATKWVNDKLKAEPQRWELCARADGKEGRDDAVALSIAAVRTKIGKIYEEGVKNDPKFTYKVTDAEAEAMVLEAMDLLEKHFEEKGRLYTRQSAKDVPRSKQHHGFTVSEHDLDVPATTKPTIGNERSATRTLSPSRTQMTAREARERYRATLPKQQ